MSDIQIVGEIWANHRPPSITFSLDQLHSRTSQGQIAARICNRSLQRNNPAAVVILLSGFPAGDGAWYRTNQIAEGGVIRLHIQYDSRVPRVGDPVLNKGTGNTLGFILRIQHLNCQIEPTAVRCTDTTQVSKNLS